MTKNPYDVLKVSPNASDDEIKRAYREMSRKYHPDANVNNPLADLAEEKFKEIQEAYNIIMREREQSSYSYGGNGSGNNNYHSDSYNYGSGNYGDYQRNRSYQGNGGYDEPQNAQMQAVYNFINNRRFQDALNVLNRMSMRSAQWYYLSAMANMGLGNNILAKDHAGQAVNMEPNNMQYRQLLNQLSWNSQRYQSNPYGGNYANGNNTCGTGNMCCDLWILDTLCECTGGDLCSCI